MSTNNKAQNPMSEYLLKLQLIINNTEFKNKAEADKYETVESKGLGGDYVRAVLKKDVFESYQYDSKEIYKYLDKAGYDNDKIFFYINNQSMIPYKIKEELLNAEREKLISQYEENNRYYHHLTGKPFMGNDKYPPDEELRIPDEFYSLYKDEGIIEKNQPIHLMPTKYQELFMNTKYYQKMINDNPDALYLKYIGSNSIPIYVSRPARDGDILRINTSKLLVYDPIFGQVSVSPDIIHGFIGIYKETRDYVYNTLKGNFSDIYPNYDSFIRFLTIYLSIGNSLNEFMKKSSSMIYMNNVTANNFFMLYGLPSVIMEGTPMIEFLKKFRTILMDKGTNIVYRVKDLIGYQYTDIYTLVMVKQQVFENGIPIYYYDDKGNKYPKQDIFFRRLGTTDDNTSYFKFKENDKQYTVEEITSGDPRWWNTPEVEKMLHDMNYTLSNSKYIQLSTHLSMSDIWWQCVILLRGLLDKKEETKFNNININFNINGSSEISIFEAVLILVIIMNWHLKDNKGKSLMGNLYIPNGIYNGKEVCLDLLFNGLNDDGSPKELTLGLPYKISSFDFNVRELKKDFYNSIKYMEYIEPDIFLPILDKILDRENSNIGEVLMIDIKILYKYLENKLRESRTIREFRQTTDVFSNLFLVEPVRNWYDNKTFNTENVLIDEYGLTIGELESLKSFFEKNGVPEFNVIFNESTYSINLYNVLNKDTSNIKINEVYPFRNDMFISEFINSLNLYNSEELLVSAISSNIKNNYKNIIIDKVMLDAGNTSDGPKTFESLLFRYNPSAYRYIVSLKDNGENIILLMRSIIKSLENYTYTHLNGLEFNALGVEQYFYILKEVITYFKSYMIEFTKDEFVYIFDGLFDNGGNSNMLRLYDELTFTNTTIIPKDSLTAYDVGKFNMDVKFSDETILHDTAIFRTKTSYRNILNMGYEILYDDGKKISKEPFEIEPDTEVIVDLVLMYPDNVDYVSSSAYKIIIDINNLIVK